MKKSRILLVAIVAGLTLMATLQATHAQVVPFRASGSDAVYSPCTAVTTGTGRATHMGRITTSGLVIPRPTANPLVFDWTGVIEFTAANGEQIVIWSYSFEVDGTIDLGRRNRHRPRAD